MSPVPACMPSPLTAAETKTFALDTAAERWCDSITRGSWSGSRTTFGCVRPGVIETDWSGWAVPGADELASTIVPGEELSVAAVVDRISRGLQIASPKFCFAWAAKALFIPGNDAFGQMRMQMMRSMITPARFQRWRPEPRDENLSKDVMARSRSICVGPECETFGSKWSLRLARRRPYLLRMFVCRTVLPSALLSFDALSIEQFTKHCPLFAMRDILNHSHALSRASNSTRQPR